jgi:hypothetical protein
MNCEVLAAQDRRLSFSINSVASGTQTRGLEFLHSDHGAVGHAWLMRGDTGISNPNDAAAVSLEFLAY